MVVEKCGDYKGNLAFYGQPVYNANRYAKLVKKRERLQNWLDYYQLKFERHPEKRPTRRVIFQCFFCCFFHLLMYQVLLFCLQEISEHVDFSCVSDRMPWFLWQGSGSNRLLPG